jgi:hypothetical protein
MHHYGSHHDESGSGDSERNDGRWDARPGVLNEAAHAARFGPLNRDQAHVPPDMIRVMEMRQRSFVAVRVFLKTLDAIFNQAAKSRADFQAFTRVRGRILDSHWVLHCASA